MAGKPPGSLVRLYYDSPQPVEEGDVVQTAHTRRRYRVEGVRVQQRGKHAGRQHLTCVVMAPDEPNPVGARVHPLHWYDRG